VRFEPGRFNWTVQHR